VLKASFRTRSGGSRTVPAGLTQLNSVLLSTFQQWQNPEFQRLRQGSTGAWLLGSGGAIALLVWDWRLCLATGTGIGVMLLVYGMQQRSWLQLWPQVHRRLRRMNQPILLALGSGGVATLSTYLAVVVWRDASSPWLAIAAILQGAGTLSVLVLLVGLILQRQLQTETDQFQRLTLDLTAKDRLKRLIAIRQLIHLCQTSRLEPGRRRMVGEYLRLLLLHEQESVIQNAALDGLQILSPLPGSPASLGERKKPASKRSVPPKRENTGN
jgi:hypothetical protein